MTHTCTKCGHTEEIPSQQGRASKARWKKFTKRQRSEEMKRVRAAGLAKKEAK